MVGDMPWSLCCPGDEYTTPDWVWGLLADFNLGAVKVWEPFYLDGSSGAALAKLGLDVIHREGEDFFQHDRGDVVISNPPFSKTRLIVQRLAAWRRPFLLIMPLDRLHRNYVRDLGSDLRILFPPRKIKYRPRRVVAEETHVLSSAPFETIFFAYRFDPYLPVDILSAGKIYFFPAHIPLSSSALTKTTSATPKTKRSVRGETLLLCLHCHRFEVITLGHTAR